MEFVYIKKISVLLSLSILLLSFVFLHLLHLDETSKGYYTYFSLPRFSSPPESSSSGTNFFSSLMPEELEQQKYIIGRHPDGTPIDISERPFTWYDWFLDARDDSLSYVGYNTIRHQIETARKDEISRLDKIRLEEAKRIAAERMARELDAKARRAREEYERDKEAKEKEILERMKEERREEEEMRREELMGRILRAKGNYEAADNATLGCPVCERIIRIVRRSARDGKNIHSEEFSSFDTNGGKSSHEIRTTLISGDKEIFVRYCRLSKLPVEERKFCYDTETSRKEIFRLLDLGADDKRICRKVKKINPDFCNSSQGQSDDRGKGSMKKQNTDRGIIYE